MDRNKKLAGLLFTLCGGMFWGLSGSCGQYLFEYKNVTADWLVPVRLVLAGYGMLIVFLIRDGKAAFDLWKTKRNAVDTVVYSVFGMALCQYTYFESIEYSDAGTATVLEYLAPVIILLFVCFTEKKFPRASELLATACALAGVFLLATHGDIAHLAISRKALFYGLAAAVTVVIYNLQPRNLLRQFHPSLLVAWAMVIGGTILFIFFRPWERPPVVDAETILALAAIVLLGTILSFTFYLRGVQLIGAPHASLYVSVEPLTAAFLSFVWLKVPFQPVDFAGFALVLSTVVILFLSSVDKKGKTHLPSRPMKLPKRL